MEYFSGYFAIKARKPQAKCPLCGHDMIVDNYIEMFVYNDTGIDGLSHADPLTQLNKTYIYCPECGFISCNIDGEYGDDLEAYQPEYDDESQRREILAIADETERKLLLAAYRWRNYSFVWHELIAFYYLTNRQEDITIDFVDKVLQTNASVIKTIQTGQTTDKDFLLALRTIDDLRRLKQFNIALTLCIGLMRSPYLETDDGKLFLQRYKVLLCKERGALDRYDTAQVL